MIEYQNRQSAVGECFSEVGNRPVKHATNRDPSESNEIHGTLRRSINRHLSSIGAQQSPESAPLARPRCLPILKAYCQFLRDRGCRRQSVERSRSGQQVPWPADRERQTAAPAHVGTVFPTEPIARPVNLHFGPQAVPVQAGQFEGPRTPPRMHRHEFDTAPRTDGALRQRQIGSPSQRGQML